MVSGEPRMTPALQPRTHEPPANDYEAELIAFCASVYNDPLGYVHVAYPWGVPGTFLAGFPDGPQDWQRDFLLWLGREIQTRSFDGVHAVNAIRAAISSGHGIGKGALFGMVVSFIMSTRDHAKGVVTANTNGQLQTKTWAAIQYWVKKSITGHWFECNSTIMYRIGMRDSWFCTPQTCDPKNSEAFAGQHNATSTSFYINDEDSNVSPIIHEVQEGGLTDGEPMYFLAGNPTRSSGKFYEAVFGRHKHRWKSWVIDSRTVALTNKAQIQEWEDDYGPDSDFFRVRVLGLPPNASELQFIGTDLIDEAKARKVSVLPDEPLVAGVDLAWGGEDFNVIRFRRGLDARSIKPIRIPGSLTRDPSILTNRLADVLTQTYDGEKVQMLFLDSAGIAGAIGHRLREQGHTNIQEVNFGADSPDPKRRFYRDHMWAEMKDWLRMGAIDGSDVLAADLAKPGLRPDNKQRVWLESKEDIKKRGEASPDEGDALALTFAARVVKRKPLNLRPVGSIPMQKRSWMAR